jgi:3-oxoacyl-[acyl-carrier-protein] synthase I
VTRVDGKSSDLRFDAMPLSVVSVGAVTAVGLTAATTAAAVRAGISGFAEHPYVVDARGDRIIVAAVPVLHQQTLDVQRFVELALPAAKEALAVTGHLREVPAMPMVLGLPGPRPGVSRGLGDRVADSLLKTLAGDSNIVGTTVIATGHAAGLTAVGSCARLMQSSGSDFGLVGAIDSYLDSDALQWLEAEEQLHNAVNPYGFIPGEGSAFCVLATPAGVAAIGQRPLLSVESVSFATERNTIKMDTVCTGQGLSSAIAGALGSLPAGARVDDIICDLNGEAYRADEYAFTIPRIADRCVDPIAFDNPADCVGDVGAASGVLFVALASAAVTKAYARGRHTLVWTSSESGERAAALLSEPR